MIYFLHLPTDLVCNVLSHWLDNRSVLSLDSAYCNVAERRVLLETVFRSPQCVLNDPGLVSLKWIRLRGVRVRCLKISGSVNTTACEDYLSQFGECVQEIILNRIDIKTSTAIMYCATAHCKFIRRLGLYRCGIDDCLLPLIFNFHSLDELRIDCCTNLLEPTDHLLLHPLTVKATCALVKSMTLIVETPDLVQNALRYMRDVERLYTSFPQAIPSYPSLVGLQVLSFGYANNPRLSDAIVIQIVRTCPLIVHLNLQYIRSLSDVSGVVIARDLHYLRTLLVDYCGFTNLMMMSLATYRTGTLEILSTMGCDNITSEGYSAVLQRCHKLYSVQLSTINVAENDSGWNNVTHMKLRCLRTDAQHTFATIMFNCSKLQYLELIYGMFDQIDFTVLYHTVPQLRVLKLLRRSIWRCDEREVEQRDKQDALLRDISAARPELKVEFIDYETNIDVMKLSV